MGVGILPEQEYNGLGIYLESGQPGLNLWHPISPLSHPGVIPKYRTRNKPEHPWEYGTETNQTKTKPKKTKNIRMNSVLGPKKQFRREGFCFAHGQVRFSPPDPI